MTALLVVGGAMVVLVAWYLARPLARPAAVKLSGEFHELSQLRKRLLAQLKELDNEIADRGIDSAVGEDERLRLESELAQVLKQLDQFTAGAAPQLADKEQRRQWLVTLLVLALVLPAVSAGLYQWQVGDIPSDPQTPQANAMGQGQVPPMVKQMVERLEQRLAQEPNNPEGWAQLGRSYRVMGRSTEALQAYDKAYTQAPENPEIVFNYATTLYDLHPQVTEGKILELFTKLHKLDPEYPGALWFLGQAAYQKQDYAQAIRYWESVLQKIAPDNPARQEVERALVEAKKNMAQK